LTPGIQQGIVGNSPTQPTKLSDHPIHIRNIRLDTVVFTQEFQKI